MREAHPFPFPPTPIRTEAIEAAWRVFIKGPLQGGVVK